MLRNRFEEFRVRDGRGHRGAARMAVLYMFDNFNMKYPGKVPTAATNERSRQDIRTVSSCLVIVMNLFRNYE